MSGLDEAILASAIRWSIAFGALGILAGVVAHWKLKSPADLGASGPVQKAARRLRIVGLVIVLPATVAYIGFIEGARTQTVYQLTEGSFAQEHFPSVGDAAADFIGTALLLGQIAPNAAKPDVVVSSAVRAAFHSGEIEIDASRIPELIAKVEADSLGRIADEIKADVRETVPVLRHGPGGELFTWVMKNSGEALLRASIRRDFERKGLRSILDFYGKMIQRLPEAAALGEDDTSLSHAELSQFVVNVVISNGLLRTVVNPLCRVQQLGALLFLAFVVVLLMAFQLAVRNRHLLLRVLERTELARG